MVVTRAQLDALRQARQPPEAQLHLTPDDATLIEVHEHVEAQKQAELRHGERILGQSSEKLRADLDAVRREGACRGQFQAQAHTHNEGKAHTFVSQRCN